MGKIIFQWVPSHVGTPGNERADTLAKEATTLDQRDIGVNIETAKAQIKRVTKKMKEIDLEKHST